MKLTLVKPSQKCGKYRTYTLAKETEVGTYATLHGIKSSLEEVQVRIQ
jgi:hypothetical protein